MSGVSEMTESVPSVLMCCIWELILSPDIGQIMCYSSQQLTLFGGMTFLNMFQRKKEAVHVKHAKISVIIDKISTWAGHICATVLWNKPSLVWLSSVFSFLSSVFSP